MPIRLFYFRLKLSFVDVYFSYATVLTEHREEESVKIGSCMCVVFLTYRDKDKKHNLYGVPLESLNR